MVPALASAVESPCAFFHDLVRVDGGDSTLLAYGIQVRLEQNALRQEAETVADQVATVLDPNLQPSDLTSPLTPARYAQLDQLIRTELVRNHIVRIKVWGRDGAVLYSDQPSEVGRKFELDGELNEALDGSIGTDVSSLDREENRAERARFDRLLEIYVPLHPMGAKDVLGAYEIYHDLVALEPHLIEMRLFVWLNVGLGFLILYGSLFTLVAGASRELVRRNAETHALYRDLSLSYDHTLDALAVALDARDKETEGHSRRVVTYTMALARELHVPESEWEMLERGALLHDIGKIGVPDAILLKPGSLSVDEWIQMKRHPELGQRILASIPFLADAARIVLSHQERWDGRGYPRELSGDAIPARRAHLCHLRHVRCHYIRPPISRRAVLRSRAGGNREG